MSMSKAFGAMRRGFSQRCANCNEGPVFRAYLKVEEECPVCGHDNGQYPADDGPAYFTILLVGHLMIAPMVALPFVTDWPVLWVTLIGLVSVTVVTLWLLPRIKGAVIGLQWALREIEGRVPGQEEIGPLS